MGNNAKRLFPIFGTVIVVTVCSAVLVFWMGLQVTRANLEVIRIRDMRGGIDDMLANLHEAETWQRYFLLTGEEKYVAQYQAALQRTRDHQAHILHWSRSGLLSSAAEKALASLIDDRIADLQRAIGLRRDKGADAALATMRNDAASSMMEDMQREVGLLKTEANRQLDASEQRRDTATFMRTSTSVGMALINLAFLGWAFFRVRAEIAKTSDQKKLLGVTLASIGDGVIVTDFSGKITFLNTEAERLTGWKNQEAQGHSLPEVFHIINEHTRQIVESPVDKVLRLGVVVGLANHTLLIARDGRETPIDDSGAPIRAEDGKMYGVVLVFRDFTAQKIAERGLARLATIVESTDDPILSKDLQGNILTWNSAAQRLLGYSSQEVVGKSVTMLLPVERQAEESQILERIRRGEQVERYETVRLAKDGRRVEVSVTISPIRDHEGQIIGASKIMRDITSRKAVERALRNNEELLRIFVWHTPAAVAMFDRDMRYLVVSKRWMLDYGLGEQNIIGRSHYEVFPDMPARWREIHQRCLAGAQEKCEEDPFPRADGRVDWVRWEVHPWRSGNEQIGGIIIFSEVITERKRAQQAMWQSSEQRRVALEAADLGAWDYRFDTGEVYWDDRCREMFGLPAGNKIPYDAAINVIHPEDRQATNEEVSQVLAGKNNGVYFREYRVIWPDGSQHWISSHGRVYFEGEGANRRAVRFIGVNMDITQRRQAREMLAQRQAMLDAVCEGTDDAIFVKDREGRLLLANPATLKVIGKPLEQVLGHRDDEFYADQETGAAILANDRRIMDSCVSETV